MDLYKKILKEIVIEQAENEKQILNSENVKKGYFKHFFSVKNIGN